VFVGAFILDGINSLLSLLPVTPTLYAPMNSTRLSTGIGMGLALALVVYPAFNATVWAKSVDQPAVPSMRSMIALVILAIGLDAMVLLENPLLLYPLALISAAGVILLLTSVYTMLWVMILKAEKRYNQVSEILYPLLGGFASAMIQIGLLDALRYFLTGTWDGFHLG
jgi:membrane-associated HD superfamily phosphohydrolase